MDDYGAHGMTRRPKWVMCGVCGELLWGGPSNFFIEGRPIPRECRCRATRVIATQERGYVQWDKNAYAQAAQEQIADAARKAARVAAEHAGRKAKESGAPQEVVEEAYTEAFSSTLNLALAKAPEEIKKYPMEPEVEYAEPDEVLIPPPPVPAQPTTIGNIYKQHWSDLESGKDV